jgi:hypothetical protein
MWGLFEEKNSVRTKTSTYWYWYCTRKEGITFHPIRIWNKREEKKRNVRSNPGVPNGNPFLIMAANKPS